MSAHQQAHKRRRDAAYERGYAACREDAAKIADEMTCSPLIRTDYGEDLAQPVIGGRFIADAIRNLRSAG